MVNLILVISLLFALVVAVFAVQNNTPVDISFLGWELKKISLVLVIFGSAAAGAVTVFSLGLVKQIRLKMELRQMKAQNEKLNSQITALQAVSPASKETPGANTAGTDAAGTNVTPDKKNECGE